MRAVRTLVHVGTWTCKSKLPVSGLQAKGDGIEIEDLSVDFLTMDWMLSVHLSYPPEKQLLGVKGLSILSRALRNAVWKISGRGQNWAGSVS